MEWPPEILSVVWEHARVAIRPMLKRRLWRDVHFELVAKINPDALCDCRGDGCMVCDEDPQVQARLKAAASRGPL